MERNLVYHYTDLSALLGIVSSNPDNLVFWGSRYDCMNDPLDYQYAKNRILPKMMEVAKELAEENSIPEEAANSVIDVKPYIVSFSRKKDDFLMWRMYQSKVALILDKRYFEKPTANSALIECEYVDEGLSKLKDCFMRIDENIQDVFNISVHASRIATFIKSDAFVTEGEIRLASWDYYDDQGNKLQISDCKVDETVVEGKVYNRVNVNGQVILYKRFFVDKKALKGIIIHSYNIYEFEKIQNLIQTILLNNGFGKEVLDNIKPTEAYPFNL